MARTALSYRVDPNAASPSSNARHEPSGHDLLVLGMVWGCLAELWLIGDRYWRLTAARGRLDAQLNDPDAESKRGYDEALKRFSHWSAELQGHDMRLGPLLANLAKHYGRISKRSRQALVAHPGWSQASDPETFAQEMWVKAKSGMLWPEGDPGFDLGPFRAWVTRSMEEMRMGIQHESEPVSWDEVQWALAPNAPQIRPGWLGQEAR